MCNSHKRVTTILLSVRNGLPVGGALELIALALIVEHHALFFV